jgi:ATP-dependent RNA helicase DDX52/ROK1
MPLPLISQSLTYVADDGSKLLSLLTHLSQPYSPPILIFTSTQSRASSLAEELVLNGIPNVDCLHAGMSKKQREEAVSRMRNGESWIMVSTDVMARGMDFKGVREVINYDFPTSVQSYIHRIGTWRPDSICCCCLSKSRTNWTSWKRGKCRYVLHKSGCTISQVVRYLLLSIASSDHSLPSIANVLLQSGSPVPDWILKLPKPSKMKRKQMGKVKRPDTVNTARNLGKRVALKKR